MNILKNNEEIQYHREIEGMGTGLVLFRVSVNKKYEGVPYHFFYENGWKPPLDIAIHPEKYTIEDISFFAQDEKIVERKIKNKIIFDDRNIKVVDIDFSVKQYAKHMQKDFQFIKEGKNLIFIAKGFDDEVLAYQLNKCNYILFNNMNDVVGLLMKDIEQSELEILKNSDIMDEFSMG